MADDEAAEIRDVDRLKKDVEAWNQYRKENPKLVPDLRGADLRDVDLFKANLREVKLYNADLRGANLREAKLFRANLTAAFLSGAKLTDANLDSAVLQRAHMREVNLHKISLRKADLSGADLRGADLSATDLHGADLSKGILSKADLRRADLRRARLIGANLGEVDLRYAYLNDADLRSANLRGANFEGAVFENTTFALLDLSETFNLDKVQHRGPSIVDKSTFELSNGNMPKEFLRGCGFTPWQVLSVRLYDTSLSPADIAEIQDLMFAERTKGYFLNGLFISYSRTDDKFVAKLYERLKKEGANVWLDTEHAIAGPLEKQVQRAIRINHVVLLVLSEESVNSDWVEAELEWARDKERDTKREVLCPIALDDSWKSKVKGSVLWRQVKGKNILDFSDWEGDGFEVAFGKLLEGIKVWYGPNARK